MFTYTNDYRAHRSHDWNGVVPTRDRTCNDAFCIPIFLVCLTIVLTAGISLRYSYDVMDPFEGHIKERNISAPNGSANHTPQIPISDSKTNSSGLGASKDSDSNIEPVTENELSMEEEEPNREIKNVSTNKYHQISTTPVTGTLRSSGKPSPDTQKKELTSQYVVTGTMITLGITFTMLWLVAVRYATAVVVCGSLIAWGIFFMVSIMATLFTGNFLAGILLGVVLLIIVWYLVVQRQQIPMAIVFIREAATGIFQNSGLALFVVPGLTLFGFLAYGLILYCWTPVITVAVSKGAWPVSLICLAIFGMFMSFWTYETIQSLITVSIAHPIARWYHTRRNQGYEKPSCVAGLVLGLTKHLGTILFGALIIAVIQTMKMIARHATRETNSNDWFSCALKMIACCFACILSCLEDIVRYINRYAMIYTSIFGHNFWESNKSVWNLFTNSDCQNFINDIIVGMIVQMASLAMILITLGSGLGIAWAITGSLDAFWKAGPVVALIFASVIIWTYGRMLIAVVDTLLVSYVEDLDQNTRFATHLKCSKDWHNAAASHPNATEQMKNVSTHSFVDPNDNVNYSYGPGGHPL